MVLKRFSPIPTINLAVLFSLLVSFFPFYGYGLINDASVMSAINASNSLDFDSQTLELSTIFDAVVYDPIISINATTKTAFFNALQSLFNKRITKYTTENAINISDYKLLLDIIISMSGRAGDVLNAGDIPAVITSRNIVAVEDYISGLQTAPTFRAQVQTLGMLIQATGSASNASFADVVRQIFFNNLQAVFNNRVLTDQATLQSTTDLNTFKTHLNNTINSILLPSVNKTNVQTFIATITLEQQIVAVASVTDYTTQIANLDTIMTANAGNTFGTITKNIFYKVLDAIVQKRLTVTPTNIFTNTYASKLYTLLTKVSLSLHVPQDKQQPFTATLSVAEIERNIEDVMTITDFNNKVDKVSNIIALAKARTPAPFTQTLFDAILEHVFLARPVVPVSATDRLAARQKFLTVITTTILSDANTLLTNLLNSTFTAHVATIRDTLKAEINALRRLDLIIAPATNTTPITELANSTRLLELGKILTESTGKTLDDEPKTFTALQRAYDTRAKNLTELNNLKTLFTNWINVSPALLTAEHIEIIKGWLKTVDQDITIIRINQGEIIDPRQIITVLDPSQYPATLDPDTQAQIFNALKKAYDGRTATLATLPATADKITFLTNLRNLIQSWYSRLTNYQTTLNTWIATINGEIAALQTQAQLATISQQPIAQQITGYGQLLNNIPAGSTLDPTTQDNIFNYLQNLYNNRIKELDPLKQLRDLLTNWLNSNLLKPAQNTTIRNVWLPQLNTEISALEKAAQAANTINGLDPNTVTPTDLNSLLDYLIANGLSLTPDQQAKVFALLQAIYQKAIQSNQLNDLQNAYNLINRWYQSGKLPNYQTNLLNWLTDLANRIKALTQISNMGTITDPTQLGTSLDEFLTQNGGKALDEATELKIFDLLRKAYEGRVKTIPLLTKLSTLLSRWLYSNLLKAEHNAVIQNEWLPTIAIELALLQTDYAARLNQLQNVINSYNGRTITANAQTSFFNALVTVFNVRAQYQPIVTVLNSLLSLLNNTIASSLLSDDLRTRVRNEMITVINNELSVQQLLSEITAAMKIADYSSMVDTLSGIMTRVGTTTVPEVAQNLFFSAVQQAFNKRIKTVELLTKLLAFLQATMTSTLLTDPQKLVVDKNFLPIVNAELLLLQIEQAIKNAMAMTDYMGQLNAYNTIMDQAKGGTYPATINNLFATALKQSFDNRSTQTLDALKELLKVLTTALTTPLLAAAQQAFVKAMLDTLAIEIAINSAMQETDYGRQLDILLDMTFQYRTAKIVDSRVQVLFFTTLVYVFGNRRTQYIDSQNNYIDLIDDTNIGKLAMLLLNAERSTLLASGNQKTAASYGEIVTFEQMIIDALKLTYAAQLNNTTRILKSAVSKSFDLVTDGIFYFLIVKIYNDGIKTENSASTEQLIELLKLAATSPLLSFEHQQRIKDLLSARGITVTTSAVEQSLSSILLIPDNNTRIQSLITLTKQLGTTTPTAAEQTQYMALLQQIQGLTNLSDPTSKQLLTQLLGTAQTSPILNSDQQTFVATTMLPSVQPEKAVVVPAAAATIPTVEVSVDKTTPTATNINAAVASKDMTTLAAIVANAATTGIDSTTTTALNTGLAKLVSSTLSTSQKTALNGIIGTTATSGLITASVINAATSKKDLGALSAIVSSSPAASIDPALKTTLNTAIAQLANSSLSTTQKTALKEIVGTAATSGLLTTSVIATAQKTSLITSTQATTATAAATVSQAAPTSSELSTLSTKINQQAPATQLQTLNSLLDRSTGKSIDPVAQAQFLQVLKASTDDIITEGSDTLTLSKLNETIQKAQSAMGLSSSEATALQNQIAAAIAAKTSPTSANIKAASALASTSSSLDALSKIVDNIATQGMDATATQDLNTAISKLLAKTTLTSAEKTNLQELAKKALVAGVLSPANIAAAQAANLIPVSTTIESLSKTIDTALTQGIDATTKKDLNTAISKLLAKTTLTTDEKASLQMLLNKAEAAGILSSENIASAQSKKLFATTPTQTEVTSIANSAALRTPTTLASLLERASGKTVDAATQAQFLQALNAATQDAIAKNDTAALMQLSLLAKQAQSSPLLASLIASNPTAAATFESLKTTLTSATATASIPTSANINAAAAQTNATSSIATLSNIVDNIAIQGIDATAKQDLNAAISKLLAKTTLTTAEKANLKELLTKADAAKALSATNAVKAQASGIISVSNSIDSLSKMVDNAAAMDETAKADLNAAINSLIAKPSLTVAERANLQLLLKKAEAAGILSTTVAAAAQAKSLFVAKPTEAELKTATTNITKQTTASQLQMLTSLLDRADGKTIDAATQAQFLELLKAATADAIAKGDTASLAKLNTLVQRAQSSPILASLLASNPTAAATVTTLQSQLSTAITDTSAATVANVKKATQQTDTALKAEALTKIIETGKAQGTIDAATKTELNSAIQQLTKTTLKPSETASVTKLISTATTAGVLTATVAAAAAAKKLVVTGPTQAEITAATAKITQQSTATQLQTLTNLLDRADGKEMDAATQAQFLQLLKAATEDAVKKGDVAALAQLQKLTLRAQSSPMLASLLSSDATAAATFSTIQSQLTATIVSTAQPTSDNVQRIQNQTNPQLQIASLIALTNNASGQVLDASTKARYAELVTQLTKDYSKLDPASRAQLVTLLQNPAISAMLPATITAQALLEQLQAKPSTTKVTPATAKATAAGTADLTITQQLAAIAGQSPAVQAVELKRLAAKAGSFTEAERAQYTALVSALAANPAIDAKTVSVLTQLVQQSGVAQIIPAATLKPLTQTITAKQQAMIASGQIKATTAATATSAAEKARKRAIAAQTEVVAKKRQTKSALETMKTELRGRLAIITTAATFDSKVMELQKLVDWSKYKTIPADLQPEAQPVITKIFAGKPTDAASAASVAKFKAALTGAVKTSLLSDTFKKEVNSTMISAM